MPELKSCPFCGGTKLKIEKKSTLAGFNGLDERVERHTFSVRCNICKARGGAVGGRVVHHYRHEESLRADWETTDEDLERLAIEVWNRRPGEVHARWIDAHEEIRYAPTVDAVPVVRCKDCQFWSRYTGQWENHDAGACKYRKSDYGTRADDYCSYGVCKNRGDCR